MKLGVVLPVFLYPGLYCRQIVSNLVDLIQPVIQRLRNPSALNHPGGNFLQAAGNQLKTGRGSAVCQVLADSLWIFQVEHRAHPLDLLVHNFGGFVFFTGFNIFRSFYKLKGKIVLFQGSGKLRRLTKQIRSICLFGFCFHA